MTEEEINKFIRQCKNYMWSWETRDAVSAKVLANPILRDKFDYMGHIANKTLDELEKNLKEFYLKENA